MHRVPSSCLSRRGKRCPYLLLPKAVLLAWSFDLCQALPTPHTRCCHTLTPCSPLHCMGQRPRRLVDRCHCIYKPSLAHGSTCHTPDIIQYTASISAAAHISHKVSCSTPPLRACRPTADHTGSFKCRHPASKLPECYRELQHIRFPGPHPLYHLRSSHRLDLRLAPPPRRWKVTRKIRLLSLPPILHRLQRQRPLPRPRPRHPSLRSCRMGPFCQQKTGGGSIGVPPSRLGKRHGPKEGDTEVCQSWMWSWKSSVFKSISSPQALFERP